ncbi:hypothetical protein KSF73_11640 [Burkholderiaceae bacterium DAT-1]|nr:hypothetical protein [Burkholderiaceae bacterium DAT-1]
MPEVGMYWWVPFLSLTLAFASIPIPSMGCESLVGAPNISDHLAFGGYIWIASVTLASLIVIVTDKKLFGLNVEGEEN